MQSYQLLCREKKYIGIFILNIILRYGYERRLWYQPLIILTDNIAAEAIPIKMFHGFPHYFQANSGTGKTGPTWKFVTNAFSQIFTHLPF